MKGVEEKCTDLQISIERLNMKLEQTSRSEAHLKENINNLSNDLSKSQSSQLDSQEKMQKVNINLNHKF